MSGELLRPAGDPDQIDQFAAQLEKAGADTGHVASSVREQTGQIREDAQWTGAAADSYTGFTSGMSQSVGALGPSLSQAAGPLRDFAASLRNAQQQVDAYAAAYQKLYPLTTGSPPAGTNVPMVDVELANCYNQAETAVAACHQQAAVTSQALGQITEDMTKAFFGSEGPFRDFLDRSHLPWDATLGDAVIEHFIAGGEQAEKALKDSEELPETIEKLQDELVKPVVDEVEAGNADAQTNLKTLLQALENYQVKKGETIADVEAALAKTDPELAKNLTGLKSIATTADVVGFLAGLYMTVSPPSGDHGLWRTGDRIAGVGMAAGSGVSIAKNAFGVDFSSIEVDLGPIQSLEFVPDVGLAVSVIAGVYVTVDWVIHNPQEAHFLLDHPEAAWCNFVGNFYGQQMWEQMGCAPRPSI
jgi:uncharacterized protein YukE/ElaB/YqjD/DUF883 family membrane-anchored ribosome-binding protein